jgi:hypothetical protein
MKNRFLILGNGGGGTSLMRGLLHAHSQIDCLFENKGSATSAEIAINTWLDLSDQSDLPVWGNKMPVEQFATRNWTDEEIINLTDIFKIVWVTRRFSKYYKPGISTEQKYRQTWEWTRKLYWGAKERHPEKVLQVSFEDLVLRPVIELRRICIFLGVRYEPEMLNGTWNTGLGKYDQHSINKGKV